MAVIPVVKNGAENKRSVLVLDENAVLGEYLVNNLVNELWLAVIDHSLDDSTPVLMLAQHHVVSLDFRDEPLQGLGLVHEAHVDKNLLDDVVAVEVNRAVKDVTVLVELVQHVFPLLISEHLESRLNDSATVLVVR